MKKGFTIWFTGLSAAGKTTLGGLLYDYLKERGESAELLDGDVVRQSICKDLAFSKEDRLENIRRVCFLSKLLNKHGIIVIASFITPYNEMRGYLKEEIENYIEVYTKCSLDALIQRDPKGLYKKALNGEIKQFTGISDTFEEPESPNLTVETDKNTPDDCLKIIITYLQEKGCITESDIKG
ncbi:MAG: adenylyl-sulfate kinase [Bacillota bacterium]